MEKDKITPIIAEYVPIIMESLGIGLKRMTEGKKAQVAALEKSLLLFAEALQKDSPLDAYLDKIYVLLDKSGKRIAKDAPSVMGVAIAWMSVDRLSKKLSELSVDDYVTEEVTKGSLKHVPIPEFRILKEQQDALNRGAKVLGLNLDEGVLANDIADDDELVKVSRDVSIAGKEATIIKVE